MTAERTDNNPPVKEIETGKWFKPFEDYHGIGYKYDREDYKVKIIPFRHPTLGELHVIMSWYDFDNAQSFLVVKQETERVVNTPDLDWFKVVTPARLMCLSVSLEDESWSGKSAPFRVEVALPSGSLLTGELEEQSKLDPPICVDFRRAGSDEALDVFLPEIEDVLGKVGMRLVPIDGVAQS